MERTTSVEALPVTDNVSVVSITTLLPVNNSNELFARISSVVPQIFPAIFDISLLYAYLDEMSTGGEFPPIESNVILLLDLYQHL